MDKKTFRLEVKLEVEVKPFYPCPRFRGIHLYPSLSCAVAQDKDAEDKQDKEERIAEKRYEKQRAETTRNLLPQERAEDAGG